MCFYIEQNSVLGYGNLEQGFVHMNAQRDLQKSRRTADDSSFRGVVPYPHPLNANSDLQVLKTDLTTKSIPAFSTGMPAEDFYSRLQPAMS